MRQIAERRLINALKEITDEETEAVVIITIGNGRIAARAFGDADEAIWAVNETLISLEMQMYEPLPEAYAH